MVQVTSHKYRYLTGLDTTGLKKRERRDAEKSG